MDKFFLFFAFFLLSSLSAFSQYTGLYDYAEQVKHLQPELLSEVSSMCNCDCDSVNSVYHKNYTSRIQNDTVTIGHSAIVSLHFCDTVPCSDFYINHIYIRVYRIVVDTILLINVGDDFSNVFKKDLLQCSYLLVTPCTMFTCPDYHWKTDKIYTVGINPGFGFNDIMLYALYNNNVNFKVDKMQMALYGEYLYDEGLDEKMNSCYPPTKQQTKKTSTQNNLNR